MSWRSVKQGRLENERSKLKAEQSQLLQTLHQLQLSLFKANEQLDAFKLEMNFNAEELEKWIAQREKLEDDKKVLEKYKRQDEAHVKDLNLQIEALNKQTLQASSHVHCLA